MAVSGGSQICCVGLVFITIIQLGCVCGVTCPSRVNYAPDQTIGDPVATIIYQGGNPLIIANASAFEADCCPSGLISEWNVSSTAQYGWVGELSARCSDGTQLKTRTFGYNGTNADGSQIMSPFTNLSSPVTIYQAEDEGVFPYDAKAAVYTFMSGGAPLYSPYDGIPGSSSCPPGTRPIGFGSRSAAYSLVDIKVVCATSNTTQDNTGSVLQTSNQCSGYSYKPEINTTSPIGNRNSWNMTQDQQLNQLYSADPSDPTQDCCAPGQAISNWTIAQNSFPFYNANGSLSSPRKFVGFIQARCTDGAILTPLKYGYNGPNSPACNDQELIYPHQLNTPSDGKYYFSVSADQRISSFDTFLFGQYANDSRVTRNALTCENGEKVVGYRARSACYFLSEFSLICASLPSDSSGSKILAETAKQPAAGLQESPVGSCMSGLGTVMQPNISYEAVSGLPIGRLSPWKVDPLPGLDKIMPSTIHTAAAGPLTSACCPMNTVLVSFNVWPSDNFQNMVGKISAVCKDKRENAKTTQNSTAIMYGYNGTSSTGLPVYCKDPSSALGTEMKTISLPMDNGTWNFNAGWSFEVFMGWPIRNSSNVGSTSPPKWLTCPLDANGQQLVPTGFAARSACWTLADFRVICGPAPAGFEGFGAKTRQASSTGLSPGAVVGIVVGVVAGLAIVAAIALFIVYKRRQYKRNTSIESHMLFNMNGSAGFYTGNTGGKSTGGSMDSDDFKRFESDALDLVSTGQMSIQDINGSKTDTSFEGIPPEWEIKAKDVKLHCVDGCPIELGKGGFGVVLYGTVYRETAAIKMLRGRQKDNESALLREITIMERAKTEYVVRFLGYSVCSEGILICMEYMSGGTLYSAIQASDEFQWYRRGYQVIVDMAKGLFVLHRHKIAHLDVKTNNVLLTKAGRGKISDLGLGRMLTGDETQATRLGTFLYMSPEQLEGVSGFASDIFALSTCIWEVVTLAKPTRDIWGERSIRVPDDCPQNVLDLIVACRQRSPKDRPTIEQICDELDKMRDATGSGYAT